MPKRSVREMLLAKRRHCSIETCLGLSLEIQQRFLSSDFFRGSECLALYSAICNEVLTEEVAREALAEGKRLVYPRVREATLEFVAVTRIDELVPGAFGVLEPKGGGSVPVSEIDTLVIPGVAFDQTGHRLGYGKGFYDRALDGCGDQVQRIGFAYDFQVVDRLPVMEHDRPVSVLMTESRTLNFPAGVRGFPFPPARQQINDMRR